ncbi:MAG: hypothetical protein MJE77_29090 [Proteobacteria bacterium]|nr:hypothetical protein [Pseudomonadota bacterium]
MSDRPRTHRANHGEVSRDVAELLDRGLEFFHERELLAALAEWEAALELDPSCEAAQDYIDFVRHNFDLLEERFRLEDTGSIPQEDGSFAIESFDSSNSTIDPGTAAPEPPGEADGPNEDEHSDGWAISVGVDELDTDRNEVAVSPEKTEPDQLSEVLPRPEDDDLLKLDDIAGARPFDDGDATRGRGEKAPRQQRPPTDDLRSRASEISAQRLDSIRRTSSGSASLRSRRSSTESDSDEEKTIERHSFARRRVQARFDDERTPVPELPGEGALTVGAEPDLDDAWTLDLGLDASTWGSPKSASVPTATAPELSGPVGPIPGPEDNLAGAGTDNIASSVPSRRAKSVEVAALSKPSTPNLNIPPVVIEELPSSIPAGVADADDAVTRSAGYISPGSSDLPIRELAADDRAMDRTAAEGPATKNLRIRSAVHGSALSSRGSSHREDSLPGRPLDAGAEMLDGGRKQLDGSAERLDSGAEMLEAGAQPGDVGTESVDRSASKGLHGGMVGPAESAPRSSTRRGLGVPLEVGDRSEHSRPPVLGTPPGFEPSTLESPKFATIELAPDAGENRSAERVPQTKPILGVPLTRPDSPGRALSLDSNDPGGAEPGGADSGGHRDGGKNVVNLPDRDLHDNGLADNVEDIELGGYDGSSPAIPAVGFAQPASLEGETRALLADLDAGAVSGESERDRLRRRLTTLLERAASEHQDGNDRVAVLALNLAMADDPDSAITQKLMQLHRDAMYDIFQSYLGDAGAVPTMAMDLNQLGGENIDNRAAFLMSRVDGMLTVDELLDVSGMPRLEAYRHLSMLVIKGILKLD